LVGGVTSCETSKEDDVKTAELTPTRVDALFALFKERESKEALNGKCLIPWNGF